MKMTIYKQRCSQHLCMVETTRWSMEQQADDIFSSKLDRSRKSRSRDMGYKKRGEARFVERIGLSTERSTNSSLKSAICSCQARRSLRIQGFWDSLDWLARRSRHALVCTHLRYIYNNVTHTPRVRLFLLFRPVARGACLRERGWFRQPERRVRSRQ